MYGIILWGNSPISRDIFKIQKRAIRIITNKSRRGSCKHFFKQLQILTLPSQYIFSLLVFVNENGNLFGKIRIFIVSTLEIVWICIYRLQIYQLFKGVYCILVAKLLIIYQLTLKETQRTPSTLKKYLRNT